MSSKSLPESFSNAVTAIVKRLRQDAPAELRELTWTQKSVLVRLDTGPATSAELARLEGVKPQSMGVAIGALEDAGFVARKPHPTDGRQVLIELTSGGRALRKRFRDSRLNWMARAFANLDKKDKEILLKATEIMSRIVETE